MIDARSKLLTETELEMMTALWELDGGTVRDVMAQLSKSRKLASSGVYSTEQRGGDGELSSLATSSDVLHLARFGSRGGDRALEREFPQVATES